MPEIARFFGVVVRMYAEPGSHHHLAHIHVSYQGHQAVVAIDSGELLGGSLPKRPLRLVGAWIEIHRDELKEDWTRLQSGLPPFKIDPLR